MRFRLLVGLATVMLTLPAFAQVDPSGEWAPRFHEDQPERIPGPEIGDYLGLPINDAARLRADSWDASLLTLPDSVPGFSEFQCVRLSGRRTSKTACSPAAEAACIDWWRHPSDPVRRFPTTARLR